MKTGIVALGSHQERHGAALPPDTDARIAEHIARKVSERTGAEYFGILESAYELPEIDTGNHQSLDELMKELSSRLEDAKSKGLEGVVLVNAHGGNQELENHLDDIEGATGVEIEMDSKVCQIEGPHAGTGELSIGSVIGITDRSLLGEHGKLEEYPEIGFAGFDEARKKYDWAEKHAREVSEEGVEIDEELGRELLQRSIESAVSKVRGMESE